MLTLNQRLQLPVPLCRCTRCSEGARPRQMNWTDLTDIPYERTLCLVYKLREVGERVPIAIQGWTGHPSVGGEQLYCTALVCNWVFVFVFFYILFLLYHLLYPLSIIIVTVILLLLLHSYFISLMNLFLSHSMGNFFQFSPFHYKEGEWTSGCMVLSCHLGLTWGWKIHWNRLTKVLVLNLNTLLPPAPWWW